MAYPNTSVLNIIIPQTSASIQGGQAPFVERIISGSRLILQTDTTGTLIGSSDLNVNSITASNISASGNISASTLRVETSIVDGGSLTVVGNSTLSNVFATNITASNISASGNISSSNLYVVNNATINGDLTINGGDIILTSSATMIYLKPNDIETLNIVCLTGSNSGSYMGFNTGEGEAEIKFVVPKITIENRNDAIGYLNAGLGANSASLQTAGGATFGKSVWISGSLNVRNNFIVSGSTILGNEVTDTTQITGSTSISGSLTVVGNSILSTVFATNITASNISASGNISASTLRVETSIVDGGTLTVLGSTVLGDTTADTTRITGSTSISGSLTVIGNSTLQSTFVTNLTASNISASGFISGSDGIFAGDVAVNGGDVTTTLVGTATLFNTNATSVNIGGGATNTVLLGNAVGVVKTAGDFVLGINNAIKDTSGTLGLTVSSSLTTVAGDLRVGGNDIQDNSGVNNLTLSSTKVSVPLTTQATSFNNGALTVAGGVGIGKDAYISGSLNVIGDLTIFGSSSVVYISSSTVIINDNIIQLNAFFPFERYAGFEVFDSGSNQRSASLLWDGDQDNWITVDQNNSSSNMIIGPTASFGSAIPSLTINRIPKAYDGNAITNSLISDDGTTLLYTGTRISASAITSSTLTATTGSITYITGALVTYITGSFTTLTISTGSAPNAGGIVPQHPTASGMAGQINVDNNFVYVYTNNIWKRVPLSNWSL